MNARAGGPERAGSVLERMVRRGYFSSDAARAIREGIRMSEDGELPPRPTSDANREEAA